MAWASTRQAPSTAVIKEGTMKKTKNVLSVAAVLLVFSLIFGLLNLLLAPKYMSEGYYGGSLLCQYYGESGGHDVILIGDSEIYANFSPLQMWRSHGITAYNRASSQQMPWQSYYVLEETLTYETPKAVVYNVNALRYGKDDALATEDFNRLTADKMRWSEQKANMILAQMKEEEDFLSYVFPILRYHDRFDKLTKEDFLYLFDQGEVGFNGHLINQSVKPIGKFPAKRPGNHPFPEESWEYLEKMTALCKEKGVALILIKSPSQYPYWYDDQDAKIAAYAAENGHSYYNFAAIAETEIGIDFQTETYDAGLHLNHSGAVKMSDYFAEILQKKHGMTDHRNDPAVAAVYDEKLKKYDEAIVKGKEN